MKKLFLEDKEIELIKKLDNEMLSIWANRISQHYWNVSLDCSIRFNGRLKRTLGWFRIVTTKRGNIVESKKIYIEISKKLVIGNIENIEIIEKILKHELCHWYLYTYNNQEGFEDGDEIFENELVRIGSISQKDLKKSLLKIN